MKKFCLFVLLITQTAHADYRIDRPSVSFVFELPKTAKGFTSEKGKMLWDFTLGYCMAQLKKIRRDNNIAPPVAGSTSEKPYNLGLLICMKESGWNLINEIKK